MKKIIKTVLMLLLAVVVVVVGYFAYVLVDYHREGSHDIEVQSYKTPTSIGAQVGHKYTIGSYNIGFGAYTDDYGFFMDGGTESRAVSEEKCIENLQNIAAVLHGLNSDFTFVQEVDTNSTRSYHIDQREYVKQGLENTYYTFALNYDSPYLFYPISKPIGKSVSGVMTFSSYNMSDASRVELPIETSLYKLLDLDRCYSKQYVKLENSTKKLVLMNFHLSAYTSDGTIANEQLQLVLNDMKAEYEAGNYVIAGGDFNKDILGDSSVYFGKSDIEYTWAQPVPMDMINAAGMHLEAPLDTAHPVPSCRNADGPYHPGQFVLTIDGFLTSPNITVHSSRVVDEGFRYSDHNPVTMSFTLN